MKINNIISFVGDVFVELFRFAVFILFVGLALYNFVTLDETNGILWLIVAYLSFIRFS